MHGKLSPVTHDGRGVFAGLPLAVRGDALPFAGDRARVAAGGLEVTATADDGEIMGVRHRELAVEGVQFHPESILTEHGTRCSRTFSLARERPVARAREICFRRGRPRRKTTVKRRLRRAGPRATLNNRTQITKANLP